MLIRNILSAQTIVPYLQAPASGSMWVTWYTTSGTESKVLWGTSAGSLSQTTTGTTESLSSSYFLHHVQLTGLSANTPYFYKVVTGTQESAVSRFVSAPAAGANTGKLHYIVYGDTQDATAVARVAPKIAEKCVTRFGTNWEDSVRFVVKLGDNVDVGGDLSQWQNLHFGCVKYVSSRIPVMTVPGNHEYYSNSTLSNYFAHVKYENLNYGGIARSDGEHYYGWQYANMLFIMFNSNETWTRQTDWVRNVVTNANADNTVNWIFAASHHPNYVEQYPSDGSSYVKDQVVPELIKSPKIAVEYSGHSHLYSRGAHKDAPMHQIINGGSSWIQRWGQDPNQRDYEDVQKTIDHYLFQIVTMDLSQNTLYTETYSNGTDTYVLNNQLIDTYTKNLAASAPTKPTVSASANVTLPYTFQAGTYTGQIAYNSTEFQIVEQSGTFASPRVRVKRDYEDIYLASNPNAYSPIDQNAGVDIFKLTVDQTQLVSGNNKIRVRFRDKNMKWSAWSDSVVFNVTNGTPGPNQTPIAYYPFNNNTNDESGFGKNATNTGVTFTVDAVRNQNVGVFNNSSYADIATGTSSATGLPAKNMTIACWVKSNSADTWGGFIGNVQDNGSTENGWVLGSLSTNFSFALRSAGGTALTYLTDPSTFTLGQWYQVVGTYDGTKISLYVNGVLKASSTAQSGNIVYPSTGWFTIGRYKDSDENYPHDGSLDNVQLWERTLSSQEVFDLFNSSTTVPVPLAEFVANASNITTGSSVTFTNTSHDATSYSWSFPGGTPSSSTAINPVVTYSDAGQYDVTLTANGPGGSNSQTKTKYITVTASSASLPSGTIVYYNLANNFNDGSGNNYNATPSGTITYGARGTSTFADFDNNSYADIFTGAASVAVRPTTAITVMAWVKVDAADTWGGFVGCIQDNGSTENGWVLGTRSNKFSFALRGANTSVLTYLTASTTFTTGQWYHVAGTYDGATLKLYINGTLNVSSTAQSGNIKYATSHWFTLGRYKDEDENFGHDGGLDEVYVVNRALTQSEITTIANNAGATKLSLENTDLEDKLTVENAVTSIFPNPAETELNLLVSSNDEKVNYSISDLMGRIIKSGVIETNKVERLSIDGLFAGNYIVNITGQNTNISKMFIKQ